MKKKLPAIIIFVSTCMGCNKVHPDTEQVIFNLLATPSKTLADGQTTVDVSAELKADADPAKRNIIFTATAGTFGTGSDKTITVKADYDNGLMIARTKLKMPVSEASITVTAKPETNVSYQNYSASTTITASKSVAVTVKLEPSSVSVLTNFLSEVTLTGILKNSLNGNVSTGNKVEFKDYYADGVTRIAGSAFRAYQASSDAGSKVSCVYSPGAVAPGSTIILECNILDDAGVPKPGGSDRVFIHVNQ